MILQYGSGTLSPTTLLDGLVLRYFMKIVLEGRRRKVRKAFNCVEAFVETRALLKEERNVFSKEAHFFFIRRTTFPLCVVIFSGTHIS